MTVVSSYKNQNGIEVKTASSLTELSVQLQIDATSGVDDSMNITGFKRQTDRRQVAPSVSQSKGLADRKHGSNPAHLEDSRNHWKQRARQQSSQDSDMSATIRHLTLQVQR